MLFETKEVNINIILEHFNTKLLIEHLLPKGASVCILIRISSESASLLTFAEMLANLILFRYKMLNGWMWKPKISWNPVKITPTTPYHVPAAQMREKRHCSGSNNCLNPISILRSLPSPRAFSGNSLSTRIPTAPALPLSRMVTSLLLPLLRPRTPATTPPPSLSLSSPRRAGQPTSVRSMAWRGRVGAGASIWMWSGSPRRRRSGGAPTTGSLPPREL